VSDLRSRCTESLSDWSDIKLEDLVLAYRKAKVDCFFERAVCVAGAFARYEGQLEANLQRLRKRLLTAKGRANLVKDATLLGTHLLVAKKLAVDSKDKTKLPDGAFFSDRKRALDHLRESHKLTAEFRVAAELPVDFHVLSALWVNRVGHRFDARLEKRAYGSRVRRFGDDGSPNVRPYHIRALGTMPPYFLAYRRWREDGLAAIRRELEAGQKVICLTLDIRNYFHRIDPTFAVNDAFQEKLGSWNAEGEVTSGAASALSEVDRELTGLICGLLAAWSKRSQDYIAQRSSKSVAGGGIPIGVTTARVLANVLLQPLDRLLVENLAPIFYGRYVDDMFLVLRDSGGLKNSAEVMTYIQEHLPKGTLKNRPSSASGKNGELEYRIDLQAGQGSSELVLQGSKSKFFFLEGKAGLDLLDVIRSEIRDLASERRLLPEASFLTKKTSAQVLAASNDVRERADTLRRADGLSIRRMGWAIQLRWAETFALDLPSEAWRNERAEFFRFAKDHVLRPERLLDHMDYLPRLLGLAVACEDWKAACDVVEETSRAVIALQMDCSQGENGMKLNGYPVKRGSEEEVWQQFRQSLASVMRDAVLRAWPLARVPEGECPSEEVDARARLLGFLHRRFPLKGADANDESAAWHIVGDLIRALAWSDLARRPLKELWRDHRVPGTEISWRDGLGQVASSFGGEEGDIGVIRGFLERFERRTDLPCPLSPPAEQRPATLLPFLFPTRPLSLREIADWDPSCVGLGSGLSGALVPDPTEHWARLARALRGTWTRREESPVPRDAAGEDSGGPRLVVIGKVPDVSRPTLCIANFETHEAAWHEAAAGRPIESLERYEQFARFVNAVLATRPRPSYLLLPELSVPRRWVASLANRLLESGISVMAGVEYGHLACGNEVVNEVVLALTDDRLGFPSSVLIRQGKAAPAPAEEEELRRLHGKTLRPSDRGLVIYRHRGFDFGVLICSELQAISNRAVFQGRVDCLVVLAWNKDLETFSALVESAALDVHAYIALVNNRKYGDSRVRVPAKEAHLRDVCRIRGGLDDHAVVVALDIERLRRFQSRMKNWPRDDDPFKPVPQGFECAPRRNLVPDGKSRRAPPKERSE
jgi:hypothetical protein